MIDRIVGCPWELFPISKWAIFGFGNNLIII
jgi:hypothetical protein